MRSLADVDRDLDELGVAPGRLAETRARVALVRPASLAAVDGELESLAAGTTPVARAAPSPAARAAEPAAPAPFHEEPSYEEPAEEISASFEDETDEGARDERASGEPASFDGASAAEVVDQAPDEEALPAQGSGRIDVADDVLRTADLPAVLALEGVDSEGPVPNAEIAGALSALALDLDAGDMPIELAPEPRSAGAASASPTIPPEGLESPFDDPDADFGALLGEADPLNDAGAAPMGTGFEDLEDEHTAMFTAADAERFSRPPAPDLATDGELESSGDDVELDFEEEVMLEDDELVEQPIDAVAPMAAKPPIPPGRTQPPPPPRTQPPEPPRGARPSEAPRGFLGKLLQRKP